MRISPLQHMFVFGTAAVVAAGLGVGLLYRNMDPPAVPYGQESASLVERSWQGYQRAFVLAGRVIRPSQNYDSVSEGQAYGMLRAVWLDDKAAFDQIYAWTEKHLSRMERHGDHLLAWHYGRSPAGAVEVLDWNSATDADLDYALALLLAAQRWPGAAPAGVTGYRKKGAAVAGDILRLSVKEVANGELLLLPWPGKGGESGAARLVNPSYFSPGHYRVFADALGEKKWLRLAEDSYSQLDRILAGLGEMRGTGRVPDWCEIDGKGEFRPSSERGTASSWDAFRVWWRVRLDWEWTGEARAEALLAEHLAPLMRRSLAATDARIHMEYSYDGRLLKAYESPALLGVYAWCLVEIAPDVSIALRRRLAAHRKEENGVFYGSTRDYYVNSWAWFGDLQGRLRFAFEPLNSRSRERQIP